MAFMGIFMMGLVMFLIVVGVLFTSAVVFLIISAVMKHRYKKKLAETEEGAKKPRKWYLIPRILSILNFAPLVYMVIAFAVGMVQSAIEDHNSLAHNVTCGNYERVEKLLKKGVDPDCTLESNEPAKDGEKTLLTVLCESHGFIDSFEDPLDYEVTADEVAMIELLIEYGADVNAVSYEHQKNNSRHMVEDEYSYYNNSDKCGYTPLMYAIYREDTEIVQLLIENGADVNHRDFCGYTPVAIVADNLNDDPGEEILRILIENGAYINNETNYGQTPQWLAYRNTVGSNPLDNDGIRGILGNLY